MNPWIVKNKKTKTIISTFHTILSNVILENENKQLRIKLLKQ